MALRRIRMTCLAGSASLALVAAALTATAFGASADPVEPAAADGPVELVGQRTETDTYFRNPDGTETVEINSDPVRVMTTDGWAKVDTDLVFDGDGIVRPKAAPGDIRLGGGENRTLFSIRNAGTDMAVSWPGDLPRPELDDNVATYADVLPGVDLRMTVEPSGLKQVLIVENARAAANPALKELKLPTDVQGGALRETTAGALEVVDTYGREALSSTEPVMWDSSGAVLDNRLRSVPDTSETAIETRSAAPATGDDLDKIVVEATADSMVLRPPADALTGADVAYPLYIDPSWSDNESSRAMVYKEYPTTEFFNWSNGASGEGVGFQNASGKSTKRLFWRYHIGALAGKDVTSAEMKTRLVHSWSCTKTTVEVWKTVAFDKDTNWNNQPDFAIKQDDVAEAGGRPECYPAPEGKQVEFNVTAGVKRALDAGNETTTFGMKALSTYENGNPNGWKRFMGTTKLVITYNSAPDTPTNLGMTQPTKSCGSTFGADAPILRALITDPEGGNLTAYFELFKNSISGTPIWSSSVSGTHNNVVSTPGEAGVTRDANKDVVSGSYVWRVRVKDTFNEYSPWASCSFTIDASRPSTPTINAPKDANWTFGGAAVNVDLIQGMASDGVTYFRTSVDSDAPTSAKISASAGKASVGISPRRNGLTVVRAWAYDAADNVSPAQVLLVETSTPVPLAAMNMNEGSGAAAADTVGSNTLPVGGASSWRYLGTLQDPNTNPIQEIDDYALSLDGTGVSATTNGPTMNTLTSFTVHARVDPASVTTQQWALTQSGSTQGALRLGIRPACSVGGTNLPACWVASMWDDTTGTWVSALSKMSATDDIGRTDLVATYVASAEKLVLYVDGSLAGEVHVDQPETSAFGPVVGGEKSGTAISGAWRGWIDDVRLFQGAADQADVTSWFQDKPLVYDFQRQR